MDQQQNQDLTFGELAELVARNGSHTIEVNGQSVRVDFDPANSVLPDNFISMIASPGEVGDADA